MERISSLERNTKETQIKLTLNLDGEGKTNIDTGVGFFDHMLNLMAFHGGFNLDIKAHGDLEVCDHHLVEDTGILLGSKIKDGDKILITEDVTTSGKSIYETMPILKEQANVDVVGLMISVNRMEKGQGEESALKELQDKYGFKACAIVTMEEVIEYLYNKEVNGKVIINDEIKARIDEYYKQYGAK